MNLIAQMRGAAGVPAGKTRKDRKPSRPKPAEVTGPGVESEFGLAEQRSGDGSSSWVDVVPAQYNNTSCPLVQVMQQVPPAN